MPLSADFDAILGRDLNLFLEHAANHAKGQLIENLSGGRSGKQHQGLPNRSSVEGEFPAEQFGDLKDSIDARQEGALEWGVGSYDSPDEAYKLEFYEPSNGGRKWLSKTLENPTVQEDMTRAGLEGR
jgi:hypothetical protein